MPSEDHFAQLGEQFCSLARLVARPDRAGIDPVRVVEVAAARVPHAGHCALTLQRDGARPVTLAATDDLPRRVDQLQYAAGQGPCLDASHGDRIVRADDLLTDPRWPDFAARCVETTGVRSMLCLHLAPSSGDRAAINFYATQPYSFTGMEVNAASLIAPFAALATEQCLRDEDAANFQAALDSSRQIGRAVGILMARRLVSSEEGFAMLRSTSQHLNRKLRDVAAEVELTGELPTTARPS